MGAWGSGIFDDDTACDVRDSYTALLSELQDDTAAERALLEKWKDALADADEGPVVWLALAISQYKLGRLSERVKRAALCVIDDGAGLQRWQDTGATELRKRTTALAKVRATLNSPQPAAKKIRPPFRDSCAWAVGELLGYKLTSGGWIALRVVAHETHPAGVGPVVELLDWSGADAPSADALHGRGVQRATLSTWSLFQMLVRNAPENASEPQLAVKRMLADLGLIDAADANVSLASVLDPSKPGPPPGFDWSRHNRQIEKALDRVRACDTEVAEELRELVNQRMPKLLEPVSQLSLRREPGMESLPLRRLKRLKAAQQPSPTGEWLAVRWTDLDEVLKDVFELR